MTPDDELLELAAKAAGIELIWPLSKEGAPVPRAAGAGREWNPLTDDGQALRLAVVLKMDILQYGDEDHDPAHACANYNFSEPYGFCKFSATRRAIVRAAAEIGRTMK